MLDRFKVSYMRVNHCERTGVTGDTSLMKMRRDRDQTPYMIIFGSGDEW